MFQGFTPETFDFLWGIRMNNNRDWFQQHKQQYIDTLYTPMKELGKELFEPFVDKPGKSAVSIGMPGSTIRIPIKKVFGSASGRMWSGGQKILACSLKSHRRVPVTVWCTGNPEFPRWKTSGGISPPIRMHFCS